MWNHSLLANILTIIALISTTHISLIACSLGVPVLLWSHSPNNDLLDNNNHNILRQSLTSRSSVSRITADELRDDYINQLFENNDLNGDSTTKTVIAFVQNQLNVEQFASDSDGSIKRIISDRYASPLFLSDVITPVNAFKHFTVQDENHVNVHNGNTVMINLSGDSLKKNDKIIGELIARINENITDRALYLLTGRQNLYDNTDNDLGDNEVNHRYGRHILEEPLAESTLPRNDSIDNLINVDNCLFFYSSSLSAVTRRSSTDHNSTAGFGIPEPTGSQCWNSTNSTRDASLSGILKLGYHNGSTELNISLTISPPYGYNNSHGWWAVTEGSALLSNAGDESGVYTLDVSDLYSENKFSYSCSNLVVTSLNNTFDAGETKLILTFTRFQLQPFVNPRGSFNNSVFVDSFDCETWLTLPLWMGLITLLVFFTILYSGVYFLSQISTNDRFENPKGKPLIITNFDE